VLGETNQLLDFIGRLALQFGQKCFAVLPVLTHRGRPIAAAQVRRNRQFASGLIAWVVTDHLFGKLERAVSRSIDDYFGTRSAEVRSMMKSNFRPAWAKVPAPEAAILWLRHNFPDHVDDILKRAKEYYRVPEQASAGTVSFIPFDNLVPQFD